MIGWRKLSFGLVTFTLVWAFAMWAPGATEKSRDGALILLGSIASLVVGGNAYEHRQQTKRFTSAAKREAPPAGTGTMPGADTEVGGQGTDAQATGDGS